MVKVLYAIITVLMIVAFAICNVNLTYSLDCFIASVFLFIATLPMTERGINERKD